jgi:hypothetical protein
MLAAMSTFVSTSAAPSVALHPAEHHASPSSPSLIVHLAANGLFEYLDTNKCKENIPGEIEGRSWAVSALRP